MSKVFLISSDHDKEKLGDVLIVLDKVVAIKAVEINGEYLLVIEDVNDTTFKQWFKDKNNCITALKELVTALGGDETLAEKVTFYKAKDDKKKEVVGLLSALKECVERAS